MKFGKVPLAQALDAVLGHTLRAGERVLKKGRVLSEDDLRALASAGLAEVTCARLDAGDVLEGEAAAAIARALASEHIAAAEPATGRCNLFARTRGLVEIDRAGVDELNAVDEAVTLATLAPSAVVEPDQLVATVKIIPFAVSARVFERCLGLAKRPLLRLLPFAAARAGLVLTRLFGTVESVLDRAAQNQRIRLERFGSTLAEERRCAHDETEVAQHIADLLAAGCSPILVLGASAIADRADVVPAAILRAGGVIDHFGMPVDPGNLLLLGHRGAVPIVGVPGCARSLAESGFDWVLARLLCGHMPGPRELMAMGVGGLLTEPPSRPQPRVGSAAAAHAPKVAAVVLAAGRSQRMADRNKLLAPLGGKPIVAHVVESALASRARPVVVVTGHQTPEVRAALEGHDVRFVHNPDFATGMASSLRAGISALGREVDGALICLGDMPLVGAHHLNAVVDAFDPAGDETICVPTWQRKRGNPVLWSRRHFDELGALSGDVGARGLLDRHAEHIRYVPMPDDGVTLDADTEEALRALESRLTKTAR
jgi:molybdenum cofactor cytidylyltransferase